MNFLAFTTNDLDRAWLHEPGLSLYVRKNHWKLYPGIDFVIASVEAKRPGRGALTRFLDTYEPKYWFRVENVLNERLVTYLERRGYAIVNRDCDGPVPQMQKCTLLNAT